jgi:hypothetical protein
MSICNQQVQAQMKQHPHIVVEFPTMRSQQRPVRVVPEIFAPSGAPRRRCAVLALRTGRAAHRAAILVKIRCLHAEIARLAANTTK